MFNIHITIPISQLKFFNTYNSASTLFASIFCNGADFTLFLDGILDKLTQVII